MTAAYSALCIGTPPPHMMNHYILEHEWNIKTQLREVLEIPITTSKSDDDRSYLVQSISIPACELQTATWDVQHATCNM